MTIGFPIPGAPLESDMLVMDVADTLRGTPELVQSASAQADVVAQLQALYARQGIGLDAATAREGLIVFTDERFVYAPRTGMGAALGRAYVSRAQWLMPVLSVLVVLIVASASYFLIYRPYRAAQAEANRIELAQGLPAQMDRLYGTIFNETKVQAAVGDARQMRDDGKTAAAKGDRAGAERAVKDLTALRDLIRADYTLRVVSARGEKSGFWRFPPSNIAATNYYIVVQAIGTDGKPMRLPITDEETGRTEVVSRWGLRVPQAVYDSVIADRADDGVVQRNIVGIKQFGFTEVDFLIPVLGGTVTKW